MANGQKNQNGDAQPVARYLWGFLVVAVGLLTLVGIFVAALLEWEKPDDVVTGISPITGVVGSLVGAFFGIQAGAAGRERAEAARQEEATKVQQLAAVAPTEQAARILGVTPSAEPQRGETQQQ
jgi:hypothetical protein